MNARSHGLALLASEAPRLVGLLRGVASLMRDGRWRTLSEIRAELAEHTIMGSEAGISARLRDLRKARFGGHIVERRRRADSVLFEYRLAP